MDGSSVLPLLEDQEVSWPDRTLFIQAHRGNEPVAFHNFMARSQRWKLLRASGFGREQPGDQPFELYDIQNDPFEQHDVARQHEDVVGAMKRSYEAWFRDVSTTRPDNYAPPRIHIGSEHENPVVLTRQDWRRLSDDSGWQPNSSGFWALRVERAGQYDVRVLWRKNKRPKSVSLEIGAWTGATSVDDADPSTVFRDITLVAGETKLLTKLRTNGKARGAYQVEVSRRDSDRR